MSSLFDNLSDELFQVLKGSGRTLTLYGEDGNRTYEPKNARRVFAEPDKMMVSVNEQGSDSEVKVYLSSSTDIRAISKLINTLRSITARYNVLLNVRKFGRELKPKDFAYQATVTEASMWGSAKTSYQRFGNTKLIIRHCLPVSEGVIGARGRNILSMFVETKEGERFKFPENHLSAGRAFAQHINQGGKPYDQTGIDLATLALESLQLARVSRYIHHARNVLGEQALALRPVIKTRITELRKNFLTMSRPRGYHKIQEAGLPVTLQTLNESESDKLTALAELLQINSNHALAESLLPVALLLGENMNETMNEMFNGVINLGESELDALVEALTSEYGYDSDSWTYMGEGIGFSDSAIFEDAKDFLEMMEAAYQINEEDAIANYATQWTLARYRQSGEQGEMDKDQQAGISELTDGLRQILGGHIDMPDYPWAEEPSFRDENARIRFFLDLFVSQHKLANTATLNYVSTIIDKMAEGKKLDGAEKTIAMKLYKALEADIDLGEGIVDEGSYEDPYHDKNDVKVEQALEHYEETFNAENFLETQGYEDFMDPTMSADDKTDPMEAKYFITGIVHDINRELEANDLVGYENAHAVQMTAKELFKTKVLPVLTQNGWSVTEAVNEFAMEDDKPGHHGFAAGDHVGTDFGPGEIDSVEGDIAVVHFLHGGTKELHVDDLDELPALAESNEEGDLSEWFNSFTPESVLGIGKLDEFAADPHTEGKMARQAGKSIHDNPYNPDGQEGFAWARGHAGMSNPNDMDMDESELDEISKERAQAYFGDAASDRARAERGADAGDDQAAARLKRRDAGLARAFSKMREEMVDEGYPIHTHDLSDIFNDLHKKANDMFANPEDYGLEVPGQDDADETEVSNINKIGNILADKLKDMLEQAYYARDPDEDGHHMEGLDEAPQDMYHSVFVKNNDGTYAHHFDADSKEDAAEEKDYLKRQGDKPLVIKVPKDQANWGTGEGQTDPDAFVKSHLASKEPKMGGDMGQNLIDQTKVTHEAVEPDADIDESADAELATLLKNAMFRK